MAASSAAESAVPVIPDRTVAGNNEAAAVLSYREQKNRDRRRLPKQVAQPRSLLDDGRLLGDGVDTEHPAGGEDADDRKQEQSHQVAVDIVVSPVGVSEVATGVERLAGDEGELRPAGMEKPVAGDQPHRKQEICRRQAGVFERVCPAEQRCGLCCCHWVSHKYTFELYCIKYYIIPDRCE